MTRLIVELVRGSLLKGDASFTGPIRFVDGSLATGLLIIIMLPAFRHKSPGRFRVCCPCYLSRQCPCKSLVRAPPL